MRKLKAPQKTKQYQHYQPFPAENVPTAINNATIRKISFIPICKREINSGMIVVILVNYHTLCSNRADPFKGKIEKTFSRPCPPFWQRHLLNERRTMVLLPLQKRGNFLPRGIRSDTFPSRTFRENPIDGVG